MAFSGFEVSALAEFADIYDEQATGLAAQLGAVDFVRRHNTGRGFTTDFSVAHSFSPLRKVASPIGGLTARLPGMVKGIALLLFHKDGYVHRLWGYSVALEDTSSIDFETLPTLPMFIPRWKP